MILLINGPFGVGKTTVAKLLVNKLRRAVLFDPEHVGWLLRVAGGEHTDFQDDPRWPGHVVRTARVMSAFCRTLVVPITLWRSDRYESIVRGLAESRRVLAVRLSAKEDELRRRIEHDHPSARAWRLEHLRPCLEAFAAGDLGLEVPTDGQSPEQVAARLMNRLEQKGD